ncbi:hypothetical protein ACQKIC_00525 [Peribacillus sp. NPDC046944]|uniref:hypothetical protein n=1 Tax=Peribacillus sp. NPDC046944 TaxID=3390607 RepID=UPI003D030B9F
MNCLTCSDRQWEVFLKLTQTGKIVRSEKENYGTIEEYEYIHHAQKCIGPQEGARH